jgi:hypothetical protein
MECAMKFLMQKFHMTTVAAGALSAFLLAVPALAQSEHVDANGMPTDHSTPAEQAQTANLNNQVGVSNAAVDAQADANNAHYQAQQQQYQNQLASHQAAVEANQAAQDQYAADSAGYESLRARYAAERAAYHRHVWPDHYTVWSPRRDARLIDTRVELWDGARVGHIDAVARNRSSGNLEAVRVRMDDSGRQVWIDSADLRFDAGHSVVATNLDRADLIRMSQEG